jgi:RsmE family RNA methyltransferase
MNTLLFTSSELSAGSSRVRVHDRRLHHVRTVHRAIVGDTLRVGILGGRMGEGMITHLDTEALELDVTFDRDPPAPLPLTLILALPRPKVVRRVLQAVAALGVKRLVLLGSWRVERSYWDSPMLSADAIREQLVLGLEQACDTILPEVTVRQRFKPFVEDELPALASETRCLLAHPAATAACPHDVRTAVTLAIGPEGGFTAYELAMLEARGFEPVSMGPRVLRVEHAVPALVGRLF